MTTSVRGGQLARLLGQWHSLPGRHRSPDYAALAGAIAQDLLVSSQVVVEQTGRASPQSFSDPPLHIPLSQVSFAVQKSPSSQLVPSVAGTTTQAPTVPRYCPSLHTETRHCGVLIVEQSLPQDPTLPPPEPPSPPEPPPDDVLLDPPPP